MILVVTFQEPARGVCRQLVRNSPQPCAVFDADLRYMSWSDSWLEAFRLPADADLEGRTHAEVFEQVPELWQEDLRRCLSGERPRNDHEILQRDGSVDHLRWEMAPWYQEDGQVGGGIVYSLLINEELEVQRKLVGHSQLQRALFERSPIGLNLCRVDGLWLESNPAFLEIIGYSEDEANGKLTYWDLTPRRYDEQEAVQIDALVKTGRYGPYEKEFIRKDGSLVPVRLNGFLIEKDGENYIWSLIEDITQRKLLEAEFEQERLKSIQASKLAMLGEMAAGIAHEINNPLAIIGGYLQLLSQGPQPDALLEEALQKMSEGTARAARIVRGLRKFARDDACGQLERLPMSSVIEDTLDLYSERLRNRGVELRLDLDCQDQVLCQPHQLSQVLLNLMNNAFQAVEGREDRWIALSVSSHDEGVALRVSDSGPGIPDELRERVFQPFFSTKPVGKGTGLGLSISRGLVEEFGGQLRIESGASPTTLVVELPKVGNHE
jgi:PAS domain S-box-containing protein